MQLFWSLFWLVWLLMLVVADPIASWLGNHKKVGDSYTDTHFIVTHINYGLRIAILAWLAYHFLAAHKAS